jgi:hypothetical protein
VEQGRIKCAAIHKHGDYPAGGEGRERGLFKTYFSRFSPRKNVKVNNWERFTTNNQHENNKEKRSL